MRTLTNAEVARALSPLERTVLAAAGRVGADPKAIQEDLHVGSCSLNGEGMLVTHSVRPPGLAEINRALAAARRKLRALVELAEPRRAPRPRRSCTGAGKRVTLPATLPVPSRGNDMSDEQVVDVKTNEDRPGPVPEDVAERQLAIYRELVTPAGDFRTRVLAEAEAESARINRDALTLAGRIREVTRIYEAFQVEPPEWALALTGEGAPVSTAPLEPVPSPETPAEPPQAPVPPPPPPAAKKPPTRPAGAVAVPEELREMPAVAGGGVMSDQRVAAARRQRVIIESVRNRGSAVVGEITDDVVAAIGGARGTVQARVGDDLRALDKVGLLRRTGKDRRPAGVYTGRHSIEYAVAPEVRRTPAEPEPAREAAPSPEELARIRDFAVSQKDLISPASTASAARVSEEIALAGLRQLEQRKVLSDESPAADMPLFAYVPATSPGKAAEMDAERARTAAQQNGRTGVSDPVAGTGHGVRVSHKPTQEFINAAVRAGAGVKLTGGDHVMIYNREDPTKRMILPKTPGSDSMDKNYKRLREQVEVQV